MGFSISRAKEDVLGTKFVVLKRVFIGFYKNASEFQNAIHTSMKMNVFGIEGCK